MKKGKVFCRYKYDDVNIIGKYDSNPILNTMVYDVMIPDGSIREYGANIIADNMYSQVYSEGFRTPSYLESLTFQKIQPPSGKEINVS